MNLVQEYQSTQITLSQLVKNNQGYNFLERKLSDGCKYDRYFHNKAQYKNAQRGLLFFLTSQTAGALAKANDATRNLRRHPLSVVAADMLQDLTFNKDGGIHGLTDDTPADSNEYLEVKKPNNYGCWNKYCAEATNETIFQIMGCIYQQTSSLG